MRALFVSVDGPKGTGKTTLLAALPTLLAAQGPVLSIVERELDPVRAQIQALLDAHLGRMTREVDEEIVRLLAKGRAHITRTVLEPARAAVVLCDRWYPSDAAFRSFVPVERCRDLALAAGAAEPDLVLATMCSADESWRRATARPRGLASRVVATRDDHARSVARFDSAARRLGWTILSTEEAPEEVAAVAARHVLLMLKHRQNN